MVHVLIPEDSVPRQSKCECGVMLVFHEAEMGYSNRQGGGPGRRIFYSYVGCPNGHNHIVATLLSDGQLKWSEDERRHRVLAETLNNHQPGEGKKT